VSRSLAFTCDSVYSAEPDSSNLFEDVPTNAQLVLRILRNAEHHNHPIPPAPTAEEMGEEDGDSDVEDGSQSGDDGGEGGEGDEQDGDDDEEAGRREKVMKRMSSRAKRTKDGVRAKARKAWDRLGEVKEHVRIGSGLKEWSALMAEFRGGHWTSIGRSRGQGRGGLMPAFAL